MKQVIKFESYNGSTFDTAEQCEAYEQRCALVALAEIYFRDCTKLDINDVVDFIEHDWLVISAIKLNQEPVVEEVPLVALDYSWAHVEACLYASEQANCWSPENWQRIYDRAYQLKIDELKLYVDNAK